MLLHDSRRDSRINKQGELVTLEEQDRSLWDRKAIEEGLLLADTALSLRRVGPYQLQAVIAALHAEARTADETDWRQITALYGELMRINSSPVIALNHAAAVAMSEGFEEGLRLMEGIGTASKLDDYYFFHAARADLLRRLDRSEDATTAYARALELTENEVEQKYVLRRMREINGKG